MRTITMDMYPNERVKISEDDPDLLAMRSSKDIQHETEFVPFTVVRTQPGRRKPNLEQQEARRNKTTAYAIRHMALKMMRSNY